MYLSLRPRQSTHANSVSLKVYVAVKNKCGLYIHVPFCHSKCAYCDFYSLPRQGDVSEFVEALHKEFTKRNEEAGCPEYHTIYIGGGTPSSLSIKLLDDLMRWLPVDNAVEITMEINPEDATPEFAQWIVQSPVNRVSMGVQSLNDGELAFVGRRHSASQAIEAYFNLRNAGVEKISLDLIYGLPGQTIESWMRSLAGVLELEPDHVSAYSLMVEPGTRLWAMMKTGKFVATDDSDVEKMYFELCSLMGEYGFEHYEISNFAKPGRRSVHNSSYWNLTPYIGIGPGAHSYFNEMRSCNPPNLKKYLANPTDANIVENESATERVNDYIMIRLRTAEGLSLNEFGRMYGHKVRENVEIAAKSHLLKGNLVRQGNNLRIPERKFLISDSVISDLFLEEAD
ncbi:MAG: radical SAM family heme chaperone HemW [Firmicutes bacterium]|nr:radical SAM family heme chaperone HemW [Bacillota bacterium]MCM1401098.1 radical SAM family heme chaperone HemW [Bacteroides sp.]MCM1477079.1 radical SAM family heme chaperone HemW [Bacteroides sp.]